MWRRYAPNILMISFYISIILYNYNSILLFFYAPFNHQPIDTNLHVFDNKLTEIKQIEHHKKDIYALSMHPNGKSLISGGDDHNAAVFTINNELQLTFESYATRLNVSIYAIGHSNDGKSIAVAGEENTIKLLHMIDNTVDDITIIKNGSSPVKALAYDPLNRYLATSGCDGVVRIFDLQSKDNKQVWVSPRAAKVQLSDENQRLQLQL